MDRALRTVLASWATAALLMALFVPGGVGRRLLAGAAASLLGLATLGGGFLAANALLQARHLSPATALALVVVALVLEAPARLLARATGADLDRARGAAFGAIFVTCFVAAWVAGPRPRGVAEGAREAAPAQARGKLEGASEFGEEARHGRPQ